MGLSFHLEDEPLDGSFEEMVAASRPATPREAKEFGLKLKLGRFSKYVRIITKDVVIVPYWGAQSSTIFLVRSSGPEDVVMGNWRGSKTGHGLVLLDNPEEMEWFATRIWRSVAVANFYYASFSEEGRREMEKIDMTLRNSFARERFAEDSKKLKAREIEQGPWT